MNFNKQLRNEFNNQIANNLEFWTNKLGCSIKAQYHLKNASIDNVVVSFEQTHPAKLFFQKPIHDIIRSEYRSIHYGVPIGTLLNTYYRKREKYDSLLSEVKNSVRLLSHKECIILK